MARVISTHLIRLYPGITEEELFRFMRDEVYPAPQLPGWNGYLAKGYYGDRADQYIWIWEIESVDCLKRFFPAEDQPSEEFKVWIATHPEVNDVMKKWATYSPTLPTANTVYTDYVVIEPRKANGHLPD
jgi:hypothetical protein